MTKSNRAKEQNVESEAPKPVENVVKKPIVKPAAQPVLQLTFNRWFALQGRPPHHKAGMAAYASVAGKKPQAAWDRIFAAY